MIEDNGLPVHRTVTERFDIPLPEPAPGPADSDREVRLAV
jgi:hypothetical protein